MSLGNKAIEYSIKISQKLRLNQNLIVINDTLQQSLKAQMKEANRLNVRFVIIIGEDEINNNKVIIRNMSSGDQNKISFDKIENYFN